MQNVALTKMRNRAICGLNVLRGKVLSFILINAKSVYNILRKWEFKYLERSR